MYWPLDGRYHSTFEINCQRQKKYEIGRCSVPHITAHTYILEAGASACLYPPAGSGNLREGQVAGLDGGIPATVLLP